MLGRDAALVVAQARARLGGRAASPSPEFAVHEPRIHDNGAILLGVVRDKARIASSRRRVHGTDGRSQHHRGGGESESKLHRGRLGNRDGNGATFFVSRGFVWGSGVRGVCGGGEGRGSSPSLWSSVMSGVRRQAGVLRARGKCLKAQDFERSVHEVSGDAI